MESFKNPFIKESKKLFNLVSEVLVPEKVQKDLVGQGDIGQKLNSLIRLPEIYPVKGDQSMVDHEVTEASDLVRSDQKLT